MIGGYVLVWRASVRLVNSKLDSRGKLMGPPTIIERPIQKLVLFLPV